MKQYEKYRLFTHAPKYQPKFQISDPSHKVPKKHVLKYHEIKPHNFQNKFQSASLKNLVQEQITFAISNQKGHEIMNDKRTNKAVRKSTEKH